ncbi:MAG TPA: hypothetical protein VL307_02445 [Chitinophagaceae bacterium]|jgi:hypothetical protein|nr:hypothetical protein [Chitinophagaceae bacterium]
MDKLSFWHKLAFIANICWVATWVMRYYAIIPPGDFQSTIIVTGLITAIIVNIIVNLITCVLWFQKKLAGRVARWLIILNFIFLIAQLYLYIK